ncbi:hypothetical protein DJ93_4673 [Bacillus clarus]|uniref:Uncharacterized protein n=1 Tax=Bacillus clarus TaxID=2338372 RepID=A0A090Z610_9BACI|nr:hypothetical protein DJ93_4673 [Bacillus clarus]
MKKIRTRIITIYTRSNNRKKIDVNLHVHINLFICMTRYSFMDEIQ